MNGPDVTTLRPDRRPRPRRPARATADGVVEPIGRVIAALLIGGLLLGSVAVFLLFGG